MWDLRTAHTIATVPWRHPVLDAGEVESVDATLLLPGGRTLEVRNANLWYWAGPGHTHPADQLEQVIVQFPKTTMTAGYEQAKQVSRDWGVKPSWVDDARASQFGPFFHGGGGDPWVVGGPSAFVEIIDSFDDRRPFVLELEFEWVLGRAHR